MSITPIRSIQTDTASFVKGCQAVGDIQHQNLEPFQSIFKDTLQTATPNKPSKKICTQEACGFSFYNRHQEDKEKPLDALFTEQLSRNQTAQYLTYLFYVYVNNALRKANIHNYQYIFKGGTSYRAALIGLYERLSSPTQEIQAFFKKYILDESSPNTIFKVSDFDSIVYLLFSDTPEEYVKRAEYVKQNILQCFVRFKELLERDPIFKQYKKRLFKELTDEWKTPAFRAKLFAIVREQYPNLKFEEKDVWIQLADHTNLLIIENPLDRKYGTVIDFTSTKTQFPRLSKSIRSSRSPFYITSNENIRFETHMPSQNNPDTYRFVLNRMKLNIVIHFTKTYQMKAPAEFIDVAFPLYEDYGLQRYIREKHYQHLNALTPYELYRGTSTIDFDEDIDDIFQVLLGRTQKNQTALAPTKNQPTLTKNANLKIDPKYLEVLIYSPYLLFDDLVVTLLQKKYPWESQKLEKRIKRFLVMKLFVQLIMKPSRPLTNSLRQSADYLEQVAHLYRHSNTSPNEKTRAQFYQAMEKIHRQLADMLQSFTLSNTEKGNIQRYFMGQL
jgi:hypothetical protein